ncbi:MAG: beta-lactamase family protein [Deltaproteobacteria bacterium]|nr:beta-lactamase family protein [Deltaproteobacteria bacterium]
MVKLAGKREGRRLPWGFLGLVILAGCAGPPPRPESLRRGDLGGVEEYAARLIPHEMKKAGIEGLSIALVNDQEVAWASGFGFADEAAGIVATPDTVYRAGSLAKLFTAAAALRLVEDEQLDLDRPLQRYVPEFSVRSRFAAAEPITPRSLLTHHSGLPADRLRGMWTTDPEPLTRVADELREEFVAHPPNLVFSYSNLGFTLLGHAIENASGEPYGTYVERFVLEPLGMTRTSLTASPRVPGMAKAYDGGREVRESPLRDVPAGGLNTTVLDLSRFVRMVFGSGQWRGQTVLQPKSVAEMLRPQNKDAPLDLDFRVGLSWFLTGVGDIDIRDAGTVAYHAGATLFHRSLIVTLPEHKLAVIVLANSPSASPVLGRVATEVLRLALFAKTGLRPTEEDAARGSPQGADGPNPDTWTGWYATVFGLVEVASTGPAHRVEMLGRSFRLIPRGDDEFGLRYSFLGFLPIRAAGLDRVRLSRAEVLGHDMLVARSGGRSLPVGEKIAPAPIPDSWEGRLGEYEVDGLGADRPLLERISLRRRGGFLILEITAPLLFGNPTAQALAPVSETEAIVLGFGRNSGETVRAIRKNGSEFLVYAGYVLKRKNSA